MSVYAFSDLHAQYNLWKQIKNYIKPEDTVFCLGDLVDRGDSGLDILYEVLNTPNIIVLKGNHEDFIAQVGIKLVKCDYPPEYENQMALWYSNGAQKTIKEFSALDDKKKMFFIEKISKMPTHIEYTNKKGDLIYLCHAGRQPETREIDDIYYGKGTIACNNFIWDRHHLNDKIWTGREDEYCVHGHTPVIYMEDCLYTQDLPEDVTKIFRYCGSHKIDIDLGSFETHIACLLDLDTFEPIYFTDPDYKTTKPDWVT